MFLVLSILMAVAHADLPADRPGERAEKVPEPPASLPPGSLMPPMRAPKPVLTRPAPAIEEDKPTTPVPDGPLALVFDRYRGQLQYCYEKNLRAHPNLSGRVVLSWSVVAERARGVRLVSSSVDERDFEDCLALRVGSWHYIGVLDQQVEQAFQFTSAGVM